MLMLCDLTYEQRLEGKGVNFGNLSFGHDVGLVLKTRNVIYRNKYYPAPTNNWLQ